MATCIKALYKTWVREDIKIPPKNDNKSGQKFAGELTKFGIRLVCKSMQRFDKSCLQFTLKCTGNNSWMSSPGVTFNLTCGKGVTELQNFTNLSLSSFAESHQIQQKNVDVSPNEGSLYSVVLFPQSLTNSHR